MILHGGWLAGQVYLWGEDTSHKRARPVKRSLVHPPTYPYGVKRSDLLTALPEALFTYYEYPRLRRITAWLPTIHDTPEYSDARETNGGAEAVESWLISALPLANSKFVQLLEQANRKKMPFTLGTDLLAWQAVYRFAVHLVARQRFLPAIAETMGNLAASWEPSLVGADLAYFAELARHLPAACRALTIEYLTPPSDDPRKILRSVLTMMVDTLVRRAGELPLTERVQKRDPFQNLYGYHNSLHDRWLTALGAPTGEMREQQGALAALATQIRDWQARRAVATLPFRLILRLVEPDDEDDSDDATAENGGGDSAPAWHLEYYLQATDDPSLLLSATDLWDAAVSPALPAGITLTALRRFWLASMGRVAAIYPVAAPAIQSERPTSTPLDVGEAFAFLTEKAALLEDQGIVVQLPSWWVRSRKKNRVTLRAQMRSPVATSGITANNLITFDWKVALGGAEVTREELTALANHKAPLVRVRGKWMQVSADDIQAALDFWKKQGNRPATLGDAARLAFDPNPAMNGLEVDRVKMDGWLAEAFGHLRKGQKLDEELPPPAGLNATLRPYQARGYAWLQFLTRFGLGACLADDMGLGKTLETLALLQRDWNANPLGGPVLVICPTSVIGNWRHEAQQFTPDLPVLVHHGGGRNKAAAFVADALRHAIIISSYSLLHRDLAHLKDITWRGIVLDEAQNIKNPETKQAKAARELVANYRLALTGTPVENSVGDLWSIMDFLNPGLVGAYSDFTRTFLVPIQAQKDTAAMSRLKQLTGPFILRRLKSDPTIIADLPDKLEMTVYCTLTKEQASLYEAVLRDMEGRLKLAEGIQRRGIILATLTRLKQVCNHPAQFLGDHSKLTGRSGKLARLDAMLEEALAEGDRALIFTQFAEMGELLRQHLAATFGNAPLYLNGQTPQPEREKIVNTFQADSGPPLLILSLKAGGLGLNLTRANHVFHFDRWWNPAVENQATDRAYRIGQTQTVQVHKFVCSGTLEERIAAMIEDKQSLAAQIVGNGEGWLTELSTDQLRSIFALRPDAVEG